MAYSCFVVFAIAALLVVAAAGESLAPAPSKIPHAAPSPVGPAGKPPASSPAPTSSPPSHSAAQSPSAPAPVGPTISSPPSEAPAPAPSSAVLNRVSIAGFVAAALIGAVFY